MRIYGVFENLKSKVLLESECLTTILKPFEVKLKSLSEFKQLIIHPQAFKLLQW